MRFTDQYHLAAVVFGTSADELRRRDEARAQPLQRWLAIRDGEPVGAVTTWSRPDDRTFLDFAVGDRTAYAALTAVAVEALDRPVHTFVDADDREAVEALRAAGFDTELEQERFRVRFDRALAALDRAWVPSGITTRPADTLDEDRLFVLDNRLRQDIPGIDGWRGDRDLFREELAEAPPFDRSAYLVAVDEGSGDYVGLVRIWRNPSGPRLGMVGVLPRYRRVPVAAALLKQALSAASGWGHETFVTETSPSNAVTYSRMERLRAESMGRFLQMVRR